MTLTASDVFAAVVAQVLRDGTRLDFDRNADHRHRGFFIQRRIDAAIDQVVGGAPITRTALINKVIAEYRLVDAFEKAKLKSLEPGQDKSAHPHLDLADLAKPTDTTSPDVATRRERRYRARRTQWVRSIVWRAAAIHEDLWTGATGVPNDIVNADLDELVDRRLRTVERLSLQMGSAKSLGGAWSFIGSGDHGPWFDGFRVRMFEEPGIGIENAFAMLQAAVFIGIDNINDETATPFVSGDPEWRWGQGRDSLLFNKDRFFLGPHMTSKWTTPGPFGGAEYVKTSGTLADAVEAMFRPELDWWKRSWIPGDKVLPAVHLEALLLGRRRRPDFSSTTADAEFNALPADPTNPLNPAFVTIDDHVDPDAIRMLPRRLMGTPNAPHFDHVMMPVRDLQVGDHIALLNFALYSLLADNSHVQAIVMEVDSDHTGGGINLRGVRLQSPTGAEQSAASLEFEVLAGRLNQVLDRARRLIANNPTATRLAWNGRQGLLVRWDPYEALPGQGAWWVQIDGTAFPNRTMAEVEAAVPRAMKDDPNPGMFYHPAPSSLSLFFPLFTPTFSDPNFGDGWLGYLAARRADTNVRTTLEPTHVDRTDVQVDKDFLTLDTMVLRPRVEATTP